MKIIQYIFSLTAVVAVFFGASLFAYWEQIHLDRFNHTNFRFAKKSRKMNYPPFMIHHIDEEERIYINSKGLIGPEIDKNKKILLTLGTCVGIALQHHIQHIFEKKRADWIALSVARQHTSIQETLYIATYLLENKICIPDLMVVNFGTIIARDIEYYNKDFSTIPHMVNVERAFGHWEGDYLDWFYFLKMKRMNQFYFARDRKDLEDVRLRKNVPSDDAVFHMAKKTLPLIEKYIDNLVELCRNHKVPLVLQTPPIRFEKGPERQMKMMDFFATFIKKQATLHNLFVADLFEESRSLDASHFSYRDTYHLTTKGRKRVGEMLLRNLEKNMQGIVNWHLR